MGSFVPGTKAEQESMLREAGYKNWDDLFSGIPKDVYLADKPLDIPEGKSELEVTAEMKEIKKEILQLEDYEIKDLDDDKFTTYITTIIKKENKEVA